MSYCTAVFPYFTNPNTVVINNQHSDNANMSLLVFLILVI